MKAKIYFLKMTDNEDDNPVCQRVAGAVKKHDFFHFINPHDLVAIKTHFGEEGSSGFVRPVYFKMMGEGLKRKGASPFLTETQTLYAGRRANAVDHLQLAYDHGFTLEKTGLPIIMADGLLGDEEVDVPIQGKIYQKVSIAALLARCQAMIFVSHFTGHVATGFGAALKNMGMGCSSRKGKLVQHSTAKPSIQKKKCMACGVCIRMCPVSAITMINDKAQMEKGTCIGCGECLAVCRFGAVSFTWSETYEQLQRKVVEHAMGVEKLLKKKLLYITFLNRITKDCDCLAGFNKITSDIGILIGFDPVAIDAAAIDLVEKKSGKKLSEVSYNIPYRVQIDYSRELGFGNPDYELVEI